MKILLAEDEESIREALTELLLSEGYEVEAVPDGAEAVEAFMGTDPDLVLLDVMMPRLNGFAVCKEIRRRNKQVPILFLTARDGTVEEVRGLSLGADDFISKTVSTPILLARLATALRRSATLGTDPALTGTGPAALGTDPKKASSNVFDFSGCSVDAARYRITNREGKTADLTLREVEMLRFFKTYPGEIHSRDALMTRFWGRDHVGSDVTLSVAMLRLREKLGAAGASLEGIYGKGYRYREILPAETEEMPSEH